MALSSCGHCGWRGKEEGVQEEGVQACWEQPERQRLGLGEGTDGGGPVSVRQDPALGVGG